jgi:hypothetical protein
VSARLFRAAAVVHTQRQPPPRRQPPTAATSSGATPVSAAVSIGKRLYSTSCYVIQPHPIVVFYTALHMRMHAF